MAISLCPFCRTIILDTDFPQVCSSCGRSPASASIGQMLPQYPGSEMAPGRRRPRDDDEDDDEGFAAGPPRRGRTSSGGSSAGAAAAGAAAGAAGMGIGMILLIVGGIAACCICIVAVPAISIPIMISKAQEAAARTHGINNLKQIALGCHAYHDNNRFLPSPRMQPQQPGNAAPDLSWRVSILPFVGEPFLFGDFDLNKGWDQGRNKNLESRRPPAYRSKNDSFLGTQTPYQYFTGEKTLFPDPLFKRKMADITDGTSNTFLCAEAATPVPWSKVADMQIDAQGALPLPKDRFPVAMVDGTARWVERSKVNDDGLRDLINPTDGNVVPPGWND